MRRRKRDSNVRRKMSEMIGDCKERRTDNIKTEVENKRKKMEAKDGWKKRRK